MQDFPHSDGEGEWKDLSPLTVNKACQLGLGLGGGGKKTMITHVDKYLVLFFSFSAFTGSFLSFFVIRCDMFSHLPTAFSTLSTQQRIMG